MTANSIATSGPGYLVLTSECVRDGRVHGTVKAYI